MKKIELYNFTYNILKMTKKIGVSISMDDIAINELFAYNCIEDALTEASNGRKQV